MKTPREVAHELVNRVSGPDQGKRCLGDEEGWPHSSECNMALADIAARDEEHSRRTELAREVLREVASRPGFRPCDCGVCLPCRARAALEALGER